MHDHIRIDGDMQFPLPRGEGQGKGQTRTSFFGFFKLSTHN
jgi:hypothetical protein